MKSIKKEAQSLIEYGLILALVAVIAVTILGRFSTSINNIGNQANTAVSASATNAMTRYCSSLGSGCTYDGSQCTGTCD